MNKLLEEALLYEEQNFFQESEQCYLKALAEYPEDKDVLCHVAIFMFKKGDYESALDLFVKSYSHPDQIESTKEDLLNHILVAYYQPHEEFLKETYEKNINTLLAYEHNHIPSFVDFENLSYLCIPRNDSEYYIWDKGTKNFKELLIMDKEVTSYQLGISDCVLTVNIFDLKTLQYIANVTRNPAWINNEKIPVYVVWHANDRVQQYLQVVNYVTIIDLKRVVFFSEYNDELQFGSFFKDHQSILPSTIIGNEQYFQQIDTKLKQLKTMRAEDIARKSTNINRVAQKYDKKYYKNLFSGDFHKIRILFLTSRFTTVVQYATRDFMKACQDLGIQCDIFIEKTNIHRAPLHTELVNKMAEFKPNIIFLINCLKSDFIAIPNNMMAISWFQDPNVRYSSREHAQLFSWNDFSLVYARDWYEQMIQTGYDKSRLMIQSVPISEKIFHERNMSQEDRDLYTADIAFPCNYQRPEKDLADLISKYAVGIVDNGERSRMTHLLISVYDNLQSRIENDEQIYCIEQCETTINELALLLDATIELDLVRQIALEVFHPLCYNLYRKVVIKWLIDAGFQVKLWGQGWDTDPYFKDHTGGVLTHGEELAKMYSCSKIVPGAVFEYTAHFRSWESMSCGALCIARYIPPEFDFCDIRAICTENEQFVFFYDKQDLIDKIKYYLANEKERQRIVENGRQIVLRERTYSTAARKCLNLIKENVVNK